MKFKKTVSLMILAGLLTASLASCVVKPDEGNEKGTKPNVSYTDDINSTQPPTPADPSKVTYSEVRETVYLIQESLLTATGESANITLGMLTELVRTGTSTVWSRVEYNGAVYYVKTQNLTTDDIKEKNFTPCNPVKTKYASVDQLNLRKYPSAENNFSTILTSLVADTEVKVIAEGTDWSKVECTVNGAKFTGFVKTVYLSDTKISVTEKDYLKYFTAQDATVMYVITEQANLRKHPYADNRGTLLLPDGLKKGDSVTVIATGIIENRKWAMVQWDNQDAKVKAYISFDCLSPAPAGTNATLDDMLKAYPGLVKFAQPMTLYTTGAVKGRSSPTLKYDEKGNNNWNLVKTLDEKAMQVKAVAYGTLEGQDTDGTKINLTWALIEDATIGYYFISYNYLTPNSDGSPAQVPMTLEDLLRNYTDFTRLQNSITVTTNRDTSGRTTPDASINGVKDIAKGTQLVAVAQGTISDGFISNSWYIVEISGVYYFITQDTVA